MPGTAAMQDRARYPLRAYPPWHFVYREVSCLRYALSMRISQRLPSRKIKPDHAFDADRSQPVRHVSSGTSSPMGELPIWRLLRKHPLATLQALGAALCRGRAASAAQAGRTLWRCRTILTQLRLPARILCRGWPGQVPRSLEHHPLPIFFPITYAFLTDHPCEGDLENASDERRPHR